MSDPPSPGGKRPPPPPPLPSREPDFEAEMDLGPSPVALDDFDPSIPVLDLEGSEPISLPGLGPAPLSPPPTANEQAPPMFDLAAAVEPEDKTLVAETPSGPSRGTLGQLKLPPPGHKVVPRIIDEVDTGRIVDRVADDLAGVRGRDLPTFGEDEERPTAIRDALPAQVPKEEPYFEPEPPQESTAERRRAAEALVREVLSSSGKSRQVDVPPMARSKAPPPPPPPRPSSSTAKPAAKSGGGSKKVIVGVLGVTLAGLGALAAYMLVIVPRQQAEATQTPVATKQVQPGEGEDSSQGAQATAAEDPTPQSKTDPPPEGKAEPVAPTAPDDSGAAEAGDPDSAEDPQPESSAGEPDEPPAVDAQGPLADAAGLLDKRPDKAYALAKESFDAKPTKAALLLMVRAACGMGDQSKAKAAYSKLPLSSREEVRAECEQAGLNVGI